jgi:hypothetical protein
MADLALMLPVFIVSICFRGARMAGSESDADGELFEKGSVQSPALNSCE